MNPISLHKYAVLFHCAIPDKQVTSTTPSAMAAFLRSNL